MKVLINIVDHFQDLGEGLYNEIGASFGDCDDLIEEIY